MLDDEKMVTDGGDSSIMVGREQTDEISGMEVKRYDVSPSPSMKSGATYDETSKNILLLAKIFLVIFRSSTGNI